jgi:2-polyprenyl-6-methoxyphenol hydroxylase-like FAD-dependent oxidoreductase
MRGERAVVLGASMAGLLAARVLADFFDTVLVVERDVLPTAASSRRGVPQGRHAHLLWGSGVSIIEGLFPGFVDGILSDGATYFDGDLSRVYISTGGHPLPPSGRIDDFRFMSPSRPLLECHVRRRVSDSPNIEICDGHDIAELIAAHGHVSGALIRARDGRSDRAVEADLVVDAMGRGGRTPAFLDGMGYGRPAEESLDVRLMYSSVPLRLPATALSEVGVIVGPVAGRPAGLALLSNENDTSMFTAYGMAGLEPPTGFSEMLAFITDFTPPHVVKAMRAGEAAGEGAQHRMPSTRWRRYDKMRRWPTGLLAIGDAICSFNPIYGQGMTVAALEAKCLQDCLLEGTDHLQRRYFRATAKPIGNAWQLATGGDLSLPEIEGPRPLPVRLVNDYLKHAQAASRSDAIVAHRLTRVAGLIDAPIRLLHPEVAARVAVAGLKRRRGAPSAADAV